MLSSRVMSNEPPGETSRSTVSNLFDPEQERAMACLRKQVRLLRTASLHCMKVALDTGVGALPVPRLVFFLDDGSALAWFADESPYVVLTSFADLCATHDLQGALVRAARCIHFRASPCNEHTKKAQIA